MIDFKSIKNSGQIFSDSFALFRRNVSRYAILAGIISLIYCSFQSFFEKELIFEQNQGLLGFIESCFTAAKNTLQILSPGKFGLQWILNIFALSVCAYITLLGLSRKANKTPRKIDYYVNTIIATLLICTLMIFLLNMQLSGFYMFLCIAFVFPILMLCLATVFNESTNIFDGIGKSFNMLGSGWSEMMGSYLVISLLCYIFLFITTSPILSLIIEMSASFLPFKNSEFIQFRELLLLFMQSFALFFLFPILFTAISVGQFSFRETSQASDLNERLQKFGQTKRSFGMQKEEAYE
jgi:hypothetical protein